MQKRLITLGLILVLLAGVMPARAQDTGPVIHVVEPGENLYRVALLHGVTLEALIAANGLTAPDLVIVGQRLVIPGSAAATSPSLRLTSPASTATHTVQPGERLLDITRLYSVTLDELVAANAINNPGLIVVGQVLVIPGAAGPVVQNEIDSSPIVLALPGDARDSMPDFSTLPGEAAGEVERSEGEVAEPDTALDPALASPDLGIIAPDVVGWTVQPGILTLGDTAHLRAIYDRGQALGNNPRAFSTVGDCNSEPPFFLAKFDKGEYNLGRYAHLQPVIDQFAGSFNRDSIAVWTGSHAWALFDPVWANPAICEPGETPLACEYRIQRPSLALIRLGTNEAGSTALFETHLRQIIEFSIERGVIPVLGTKADRIEGSDAHNDLIRRLAAEYDVPLWDFGKVADTLPGRGLMPDGFHLNYVSPDYTASYALQYGHPAQNLLALMALNNVWRNVIK